MVNGLIGSSVISTSSVPRKGKEDFFGPKITDKNKSMIYNYSFLFILFKVYLSTKTVFRKNVGHPEN